MHANKTSFHLNHILYTYDPYQIIFCKRNDNELKKKNEEKNNKFVTAEQCAYLLHKTCGAVPGRINRNKPLLVR